MKVGNYIVSVVKNHINWGIR